MPKRLLTQIEQLESYAPPAWLSESCYRGWQRLPAATKAAINAETDVRLQAVALLEVLPQYVRKDVLQQVRDSRPDIAGVIDRLLRL